MLPWITSFFQVLRDSEPEIQRRVNEMDKVSPSIFVTPILFKINVSAAPRGPHYVGQGTTEVVQYTL